MKSRALAPIVVAIITAALASTVILLLAPGWLQTRVRIVAGYDLAVIAILIWYWAVALRTDATETKRRAAAQDPGRDIVFIIILTAAAFAFVVAFDILGRGTHEKTLHPALVYGVGFGAVILGWLLIHTIFTFRYAHLYYGDRDRDEQSDLGLFFPGGEPPNYIDFAYFSFVIGMTFQVSDVQITAKRIRRQALGHALISFAYSTSILALVVNIVSNLLH